MTSQIISFLFRCLINCILNIKICNSKGQQIECLNVLQIILFSMKQNNKNKGWCEDVNQIFIQEDKLINDLVLKYGTKNWAKIAEQLHLVYGYRKKSGKQCRQRWHNHLDPNIIKKSWAPHEEDIMFEQHKKHGNKWTIIAEKLPGRTDNSIKNHFYSTIRRSLRRISKFMGSKNSTTKMRKIKPSTLSKIFSLSQSKASEGSTNFQFQQKIHEQNCKQIAHYLLDFSRKKLSDKRYEMDQQDMKKFQKILEEMVKINDIYENQKIVEAKLKKQKYLQRNFDEAAESQSEDQNQISQNQKEQLSDIQKNQDKYITRSQRKVKVPNFRSDKIIFLKKQKINIQKGNVYQQMKVKEQQNVTMKIMMSPLRKIQEQNYLYGQQFGPKYSEVVINEVENKFDFTLELNEENMPQLDQLNVSPGIRNTPFALTPSTYQFMKQANQHQPLKNQDCNLMVNKIINDIRRNTNNQYGIIARSKVFQSPSSAFKQCY